MKFSINSTILYKALDKPKKAILQNPVIPILENFAFQVLDNRLTITASDMKTIISNSIDVNSDSDFGFCVPASLLLNYLASTPDQPLNFEFDEQTNVITILISNGKTKLATESIKDYPFTKNKKEELFFEIDSDLLSQNIKSVLNFVSTDDVDLGKNGVLIQNFTNEIHFVGTDGNVMRMIKSNINYDTNFSFFIQYKNAKILSDILDKNSNATIYYNENYIKVISNNISFETPLKNDKFPPYQEYLPRLSFTHLVSFNKSDLISSINRTYIAASGIHNLNEKYKKSEFIFSNNQLIIKAEDVDYGNKSEEIIPVNFNDELTMTINVVYLKETLNSFENDELYMSINKDVLNIPILITNKKENDFSNFALNQRIASL